MRPPQKRCRASDIRSEALIAPIIVKRSRVLSSNTAPFHDVFIIASPSFFSAIFL